MKKVHKQDSILRFVYNSCFQSSLICWIFSNIFFANVWISQSDHHNFNHHKMPRISKRAGLLKRIWSIGKKSC